MNILAVDLSLRTTACVKINNTGLFLDCFCVISSSSSLNDEDLIIYNTNNIVNYCKTNDIKLVIIEGLSFNSLSSAKDLIAGNFWHLRAELHKLGITIQTVAPASWRKNVFTDAIKKNLQEKRKNNIYLKGPARTALLKEAALSLVPQEVKSGLIAYLRNQKLNNKYLYDLADAYCISLYCINTLPKKDPILYKQEGLVEEQLYELK